MIKQYIIDADIIGLGRSESITYVKSKLGLDEKTSFSEDPTKNIEQKHYQMTITLIGYHIMQDKDLLNFIERGYKKWN